MTNKHKFENSSSIAHCDYHENTGTLEIGFTSGHVYHYPDCPKEHHDGLKKTESPGKYFHSQVRKYKAVKVK